MPLQNSLVRGLAILCVLSLAGAAAAQTVAFSNQQDFGFFNFNAFTGFTEWEDLQLVAGGELSEISLLAIPPNRTQSLSGFFDLRLFDESQNRPQGTPLGVLPFDDVFPGDPTDPSGQRVVIGFDDLASQGITVPDAAKLGVGVHFDDAGWRFRPAGPPEVGSSPGGNWVAESPSEGTDFQGLTLPWRLVVDEPTPPAPGAGGYTLFETAEATPNGQINPFQSANSSEYYALNFEVQRTTRLSEVGAHGVAMGVGDSVFAAIVELDNAFATPLPSDISGDRLVASTLMELPRGEPQDFSAEIDATLEPGAYALVFGSGLFGADGALALRDDHTQVGPWSEYTLNSFTGQRTPVAATTRVFLNADSAPGTMQARPEFDVEARVLDGLVTLLIDGGDILVRDNDGTSDALAVMEFSLEDLPAGRSVEGATLELDLNLLTGAPLAFDIVGYAADGVQQVPDGIAGSTVIGTANPDGLGVLSFDLDPLFVEGLRGQATHLGLRIVPTDSGNFRFETLESGQFGEPPLLTLELSDPIAGDFNGDGAVDLLDLDILGSNFGATDATLAQGDANGDGTVDLLDLDILGVNFGETAAAVPEPAAVVYSLLVAAAFFVARQAAHRHNKALPS